MSAKTLQLSDCTDSVMLIYYMLTFTVGGDIRRQSSVQGIIATAINRQVNNNGGDQ